MELKTFYSPGISHFSYMILSDGKAVVIDPQRDVEEYLSTAAEWQVPISHIFLTHTHADFSGGQIRLSQLCSAPIIMGDKAQVDYPIQTAKDGDVISLGGVDLQVMETPGHTPDHISLLLTDHDASSEPLAVFSGDSLFSGDVGRPDLFGPDLQKELTQKLFETMEKYRAMPDGVLVYPAHGAGSLCGKRVGQRNPSTIGYEKQANLMLQLERFDMFEAELQSAMPTPPAYYFITAKKNATGEGLELPFQQPQSLSTKDVANWNGTILDLRDQAGFAASHIPGSLNTVTDEHFSLLIGFAIDPHSDIALVGSPSSVSTAAMRLYRMGYDHVKGYLAGGIDAWRKEARQTASFTYLTPQEAEQNMKSGQALLVDIRTESEQAGERIAQAKSMPLAKLKDQQEELPKDKQIIFLCGHGCRGSLASSMLKSAGFSNVANLAGGMVGWKAAGLSTETSLPSEVDKAA